MADRRLPTLSSIGRWPGMGGRHSNFPWSRITALGGKFDWRGGQGSQPRAHAAHFEDVRRCELVLGARITHPCGCCCRRGVADLRTGSTSESRDVAVGPTTQRCAGGHKPPGRCTSGRTRAAFDLMPRRAGVCGAAKLVAVRDAQLCRALYVGMPARQGGGPGAARQRGARAQVFPNTEERGCGRGCPPQGSQR